MKTAKIRILPTKEQREYFAKAFGIRRWTWNWAVAEFFEQAKVDKFPTRFELQRQLNNTLVKQAEYAWLNEVNSMVRQEALADFGQAVKRYAAARHEAKRRNEKCDVDKYKPHFKKKGKCSDSFRYSSKGTPLKIISKKHFTLTTYRGRKPFSILTTESVWFLRNAKICTATFSREADQYFVCITYEKTNRKVKQHGAGTVGLDLGIKHPVVAYDGVSDKIFDLPKSLFEGEKRREHVGRLFSRCEKDSNRAKRRKLLLEKKYRRENNIKRQFREEISTWLVRNFDLIKIDDFQFASALNLRHVARALHRVGSYAFKERLKTKAAEYGVEIVVLPKGTPTTQTCSNCGHRPEKKIELKDRTYVCEHCGSVLDRDINAARNAFKL